LRYATAYACAFDVEEEALQFALSFGAAIEVIGPAELREKVATAAGEIMERYSVHTAK